MAEEDNPTLVLDEEESEEVVVSGGEGFSGGEPPEEAKIFVGNLPYDVDSEQLAQLFQQAGVVEISEVLYFLIY